MRVLILSFSCDLATQGFWKEAQEQKPKMETVISAGKQVALELPWSGGVSVGEGLRAQCSAIEERWGRVWQATEQWGETLDKIHPEMEQFQVRMRGEERKEGGGERGGID